MSIEYANAIKRRPMDGQYTRNETLQFIAAKLMNLKTKTLDGTNSHQMRKRYYELQKCLETFRKRNQTFNSLCISCNLKGIKSIKENNNLNVF